MSEVVNQGKSGTPPKVSIGMAVFNGEPFIREALDSLLAQTFTNFELIISDNASTDGTEAICREYAACDARIRYVRQPENRGGLLNFQFVLDEARGEYFMWAAADDMWHREFIRKCLLCFEQDQGFAVVLTKYWTVSRMFPLLKMRYFPDMSFLSSNDPFTRISNFVLLRESSHKANLIYGLWRRAVAQKMVTGFKDMDGHFAYLGIDIAQIIYVLASSRAYQIPEVLFFKTYKRFPPGHLGSLILHMLIRPTRDRQNHEYNIREHVLLLQRSLELAGIYDERYKEILAAKYKMGVESNHGVGNILREAVASLRAGVV